VQEVAQRSGPYRATAGRIYSELRQNVVSTVYESWKTTGFAWEQYNPDTGSGQRAQHFTGWTALIVKMMAFPDLERITKPHPLYISSQESTKGFSGSFPFLLLISILAMLYLNRPRFGRLAVWMRRRFQLVQF